MNTAILVSFTIPAIVATVLTIMLIKERDYFFHNRNNYHFPDRERTKKKKSRNNSSDDLNNWDFSGGTMGL